MSDKLLPTESETPTVPAVLRTYNMEQSGDGTNIAVAQNISLTANGEAGIQAGNIENVNVNIQNVSVVPQLLTPKPGATTDAQIDPTYYNLIVVDGVDWQKPNGRHLL